MFFAAIPSTLSMLYSDVITAVRSSISVKRVVSYPSIHCFSVATPHTCGSSNMVLSRPIPRRRLRAAFHRRFCLLHSFYILMLLRAAFAAPKFLIRQVPLNPAHVRPEHAVAVVGVAVMPVVLRRITSLRVVVSRYSWCRCCVHGNDEVAPSISRNGF